MISAAHAYRASSSICLQAYVRREAGAGGHGDEAPPQAYGIREPGTGAGGRYKLEPGTPPPPY
eukprot:CAMPEP_0173355696 /NCGR_PEP_ID=MMETSP1144-20121109/17900_1 /TAXON_ID=483371 /ORGANISM="non described non described, Strain CCMP2298" /LENGTH=62 /DNA_ID=CAMNT_0014304417 /DNA_START=305 /DNA_END=493 /DNA_ORIENTATION=-